MICRQKSHFTHIWFCPLFRQTGNTKPPGGQRPAVRGIFSVFGKDHSGAFMLSTMDICLSLRPMNRFTIRLNRKVSARA